MKRTYRVTISGMQGYKEFNNKHPLRLWLMNYIEKEDIKNLNITIIGR
jgi:hypothetical protein